MFGSLKEKKGSTESQDKQVYRQSQPQHNIYKNNQRLESTPFIPVGFNKSQNQKDMYNAQNFLNNVPQQHKNEQNAHLVQINQYTNTYIPRHAFQNRFQTPIISMYCESSLNNDFACLMKHKQQLCKELSFLIENWDILWPQFQDEVQCFIGTFRYKIQNFPTNSLFYSEVSNLVRKLQIKLGYEQKCRSEDWRITDFLFKNFMQAQAYKYNQSGMYVLVDQRCGTQRKTTLHDFIKQTPQFWQNPHWPDIFSRAQSWLDNRLKYGQFPNQVPRKRKQKKMEIYKMEPDNCSNLFQLQFLYEGSNIYNSFNSQIKLGVCGNIRDLWTHIGQLQFMRQLTGILNNGGGAIVWDCTQNCLKLQAFGEQLMEQNKVQIYNRLALLLLKIKPKVIMGVHCVLQFVPIAYKPTSEYSWSGDKFKLSFKNGFYMCLLKIINYDKTNIYFYSSPGVFIKYYKELSWLRADNMQEQNGQQKQEYREMQLNRQTVRQKLGLNPIIFNQQGQKQRQMMVEYMKNHLQSTISSEIVQSSSRKKQQMVRQHKLLAEKPAQWQITQTKMLLENNNSLHILQQHKYNEHVNKFYFLPLNALSINSFLYKQSIPKYCQHYKKIYSKKAQLKQLRNVYDKEAIPFTLSMTNIQRERSVSSFLAKKMQLSQTIQQQLRMTIYGLHSHIQYIEQGLLWYTDNNNPQQHNNQQQILQCQSLCAILYFLRDRLHSCMEQLNHINSQYFKKVMEKHKQLGRRHQQLNKMRLEIYRKSQINLEGYKQNTGLDACEAQANLFLDKMIKIMIAMIEQHREHFRVQQHELQTIALVKSYYTSIKNLRQVIQSEKCVCFDNNGRNKCLRYLYLQKLFLATQICETLQPNAGSRQQKTSSNLELKSCLMSDPGQRIKQKDFKHVLQNQSIILKNLNEMAIISNQKLNALDTVMKQFTPKFQIYHEQTNLLQDFIYNIKQIWVEYFCLQPQIKQMQPASIPNPIKTISKENIGNPEKDYPYASLFVARQSLIPRVKDNLAKYGIHCEIVTFNNQYRHMTQMINVLYHYELCYDINKVLMTKPEFVFNRKRPQLILITDYIKLTERTKIMSREQFKNIANWMRFEFAHESLMLMQLDAENNVEYYIKTGSRKSTALIYTVLTRQARHGGYSIEGQSNECAFMNPQLPQTELYIIYSSTRT